MHYYSFPRLSFFKNDGASVDCNVFKEALFAFIEKNFIIVSKVIQYGDVTYMSPDKDNQFIEGYIRTVYYKYIFANHHEVVVQFFDEESPDNTFKKSWVYNFYHLSFSFIQGDGWSWVKKCWDLLKPFMEEYQFRDATLSYTQDDGFYAHFKKKHEEEAMEYIAKATFEEIKGIFEENKNGYIEIQHKPYIDVDALLKLHPDKSKINSIAINHNDLKKWPESLFDFTEVTSLMAYGNPINSADERFSVLKKLNSVAIHSNPLFKNEVELTKLKSYLPINCQVS